MTYSDTFLRAVKWLLKAEGGYVAHPRDKGGPTNLGISKRHHPDAWLDGKVTLEEAVDIIFRDYWTVLRCSFLPPKVALVVLDYGFHSGVVTAAKALQEVVGTTQDGRIGPVTLRHVEAYSEDYIVDRLLTERSEFLERLVKRDPSQRVFLKGWRNRLRDLRVAAADF